MATKKKTTLKQKAENFAKSFNKTVTNIAKGIGKTVSSTASKMTTSRATASVGNSGALDYSNAYPKGTPTLGQILGQREEKERANYNTTMANIGMQDMPPDSGNDMSMMTASDYTRALSSGGGSSGSSDDSGAPQNTGITREASKAILSKYGVRESPETDLSGMSEQQAINKAKSLKLTNDQRAQTSSMTSYAFNSDSMNRMNKIVENFNVRLNDINNDPWESKGSKIEKKNTVIDTTSQGIANLFETPEQFMSEAQTNPSIAGAIESYVKSGGKVENIISKIKPTQDVGNMSTGDYLSSIDNADNSPVSQEVEQDLFPEREIAQKEIMRVNNIPEEEAGRYFGTAEEIGILENNRMLARERARLLERKLKDDKATLREKAEYEIEKNNAELEADKNEMEQNRLNAKNYLTGMLAKLGALTTTGVAPEAFTVLDFKYQQQKQKLETDVAYRNRQIEVELKDRINSLESDTEDDILRMREDLSKDEDTVAKEIMKLRRSADDEISKITMTYAKELRSNKEKYVKEQKSANEEYVRKYQSLVSQGYNEEQISSILGGNVAGKPEQDTQSRWNSIDEMPTDLRDKIIDDVVMKRASVQQLYKTYPNVSRSVLNVIFNRFARAEEIQLRSEGDSEIVNPFK